MAGIFFSNTLSVKKFPEHTWTGLKAHQRNCHTIWQPLISAVSINPLYWLSPVKFGIKSTCDGT